MPAWSSHTIRNFYAAFGRGDMATVLGALAPDVQWSEAEGFPHGGTYVGPTRCCTTCS